METSEGLTEGRSVPRPLHGGRHGIPKDLVSHNQRERLLAAMAATAAEHGYDGATVARVIKAASVSRRTFYEHFENKEACFLATYDALQQHVDSLIEEAVGSHEAWEDQVAAALASFVGFLSSRPRLARVYLVEAVAAGELTMGRREESVGRFIELLRRGREERDSPAHEVAEGMEEALAGGVFELLGRRTLAGEADRLESYVPALIEFVLAPYMGAEKARSTAASIAG